MPMTQGATRLPWTEGSTGILTMTNNSNKERGEKRGVLSTGRARKQQDADADAANDDDED